MAPKHHELVTTLVGGYSMENEYFLISLNAKRFWNVPKTKMQRFQIQIGDCCVLTLVDEKITGFSRKTEKFNFNVVVTRENCIIVENVVGRVKKQQRMIYFSVRDFGDVAFIGDKRILIRENPQPGTEWKLRLRLLRDNEKTGFLRDFDWGTDLFDEIHQLETRRTRTPHRNQNARESRSRTRGNDSSYRSQSRQSHQADSSESRYEWNDRGRNTSRDQSKRRNERSKSAGPLRRSYQNDSQLGLNQYSSRDDSRQGQSSRMDNAKTDQRRSRSILRTSSESIRSNSKNHPSTSNTISNKPRVLLITAVQNFNTQQQKFWLWDVEKRSNAFYWGEIGNDALKVGHIFEGVVYNMSQAECTIIKYDSNKRTTYHELFGDIIAPNRMIPRRQWNQLRINIYITKSKNGVGSVWIMSRIISPEEQLIDEFRAVWTHQLFRKQIQCDVYHDSDFDPILDNFYNTE